MKRVRFVLWAAPVLGILLLAQCQSPTSPRMPEPDPPEERDSIPSHTRIDGAYLLVV